MSDEPALRFDERCSGLDESASPSVPPTNTVGRRVVRFRQLIEPLPHLGEGPPCISAVVRTLRVF